MSPAAKIRLLYMLLLLVTALYVATVRGLLVWTGTKKFSDALTKAVVAFGGSRNVRSNVRCYVLVRWADDRIEWVIGRHGDGR